MSGGAAEQAQVAELRSNTQRVWLTTPQVASPCAPGAGAGPSSSLSVKSTKKLIYVAVWRPGSATLVLARRFALLRRSAQAPHKRRAPPTPVHALWVDADASQNTLDVASDSSDALKASTKECALKTLVLFAALRHCTTLPVSNSSAIHYRNVSGQSPKGGWRFTWHPCCGCFAARGKANNLGRARPPHARGKLRMRSSRLYEGGNAAGRVRSQ